jgi:hypothetical protein
MPVPRKVVNVINGRRIVAHDPIGYYVDTWYTVELRGPTFEGQRLEVWTAFSKLADAIAEAERLGPIPDDAEEA